MLRRALGLALLAAIALALEGCPSLTERTGLPPSIDRAQALESSGDQTEAARVYEQLAAQNSGADRNRLLLRSARERRWSLTMRSLSMLPASHPLCKASLPEDSGEARQLPGAPGYNVWPN